MGNARFGKFEVDRPGVASIFKSGPMVSVLKSIADPIGEACEAEALGFVTEEMHVSEEDIEVQPMYRHGVDGLDYTAVGYVFANGLGKVNETANHSLSRRNH